MGREVYRMADGQPKPFPPGVYDCDSGTVFVVGPSGVCIEHKPSTSPQAMAWPIVCLSTLTVAEVLALPIELLAEVQECLGFIQTTDVPQEVTSEFVVNGEKWAANPLLKAGYGTWLEVTRGAVYPGYFSRFAERADYKILPYIIATAFTPEGKPITDDATPPLRNRQEVLLDCPLPAALGAFTWLCQQIEGVEKRYAALFTPDPPKGSIPEAWAKLYRDNPQRLGKDLGFHTASDKGMVEFLSTSTDTILREALMIKQESLIKEAEARIKRQEANGKTK